MPDNPRTVRDAATRSNVPARVTRTDAIAQAVAANQSVIAASLPTGMTAERFTRLLLTASSVNPALMNCDPRSFLAAGVTAAQLGLEPNDPRGLAYLIPFSNKVQLIIGYRGYMDLARRSGQVGAINAYPVYDGDTFHYELGLDPTLVHVPADGDENPDTLTHVYATAKVNGEPQFVVLTRKQVERARAQSQTGKVAKSPWGTHYVEMAQKTAIRRLCKYLPQTVELATALAREERDLTLGEIADMAHVPADHDPADVIDATHTPGLEDTGYVESYDEEPDPEPAP